MNQRLIFCLLFITAAHTIMAQPTYRDSIKKDWQKGFKKIFKGKEKMPVGGRLYAFDKKTLELKVAVTPYFLKEDSTIAHGVYYYYKNNKLIWFKLLIQYGTRRKTGEGYAEYFFSDTTLVDKFTKGKVMYDYAHLLEEGYRILAESSRAIKEKWRRRTGIYKTN